MNFGVLLTNTMNDKNITDAKKRFLAKINKYKENIEKKDDEISEKINYYNNRFQKKREINDETYLNYIQSFTQLKDNWIKSNKENDLEKLKNLKKPILIDVEDIYTYMIIRNKKFKN